MSQTQTAPAERKKFSIPKYLVITMLTILAVGPQYFTNLAYSVNQIVVQGGLNLNGNIILYPSILSNLAFALGVPLGRVLSRRYGLRPTYLVLIFAFLVGSILNTFSADIGLLIAGRSIQGLTAGMLFLTIIPATLMSFPGHIRNFFLFFVISGLFGSSAVGAFFGALSLSVDAWRWLFSLNIITAVICLVVGLIVLPKPTEKELDTRPIDKTGVFLLTVITLVTISPLLNLQQKGFDSLYVWPFLVIDVILLGLFINVDSRVSNPLVPLHSLWSWKAMSGATMAIVGHLLLVVAIAGINGILRNILDIPFRNLSIFYLWFFIGIVVSALICTFLYDVVGAGTLGIIGSIIIIVLGIDWIHVGFSTSITTLYAQIAFLGIGISMALVSGALGTALAGDLHYASDRSVSLHSVRNFLGALITPVVAWFITTRNAVHYEDIRNHVINGDPEVTNELTKMIQYLMAQGQSLADAKTNAMFSVVVNAKKAAILEAYHNTFVWIIVLGAIMLIASIGKAVTGKGLGLRSKEEKPKKEKQALLPSPKNEQ